MGFCYQNPGCASLVVELLPTENTAMQRAHHPLLHMLMMRKEPTNTVQKVSCEGSLANARGVCADPSYALSGFSRCAPMKSHLECKVVSLPPNTTSEISVLDFIFATGEAVSSLKFDLVIS